MKAAPRAILNHAGEHQDDFRPVVFAELIVDRRHVVLDRAFADEKDRRDLRIRAALGNEAADLLLALGHAVVVEVDAHSGKGVRRCGCTRWRRRV